MKVICKKDMIGSLTKNRVYDIIKFKEYNIADLEDFPSEPYKEYLIENDMGNLIWYDTELFESD